MSLRDKIAKEFVFYSASFAVMQAINIFVAIYIRNTLGLEQMGIWVALQVILTYAKYSNLGLDGAASREIPYEKGQGHRDRVDSIRNSSYTFTLLVSAALSALMAAASLVVWSRFGKLYGASLLALAFLSFFQRASTFCIAMARAEKRFDFINRFNIYSSIMNAVLIVVLTTFFSLYGYYAAMVLSFVFNYLYLVGFSGIPFRLQWNWPVLSSLFKMSLVLVLVNLTGTFFVSLDKLSITAFLSVKALGVYSIVLLANNLILMLPNNLSVIIFPYLNEAYGASPDGASVKKLALLPNEFMAHYLPILIGFFWIISPYLVRLVLPKYTDGIPALQIGLWACLFSILSGNMGSSLVTFKKYGWMIPLQLTLALAIWVTNGALVRHGFGLEAIAATNLAAYVLLWAATSGIALRSFKMAASLFWAHALKILTNAFCAFLALALLDVFLPERTIGALILKLAFWVAASGLILFFGERSFETSRIFRKLLSKEKNSKVVPAVTTVSEAT